MYQNFLSNIWGGSFDVTSKLSNRYKLRYPFDATLNLNNYYNLNLGGIAYESLAEWNKKKADIENRKKELLAEKQEALDKTNSINEKLKKLENEIVQDAITDKSTRQCEKDKEYCARYTKTAKKELNKLKTRIDGLQVRVDGLQNILDQMLTLETSTQTYVLQNIDSTQVGTIKYDSATGNIIIVSGNTANFIHELTHAIQFEKGDLAFNTRTGASLLQDIFDEVAGYKNQFFYDPESITGLNSNSIANTVDLITADWVQHIQDSTGNLLYAPGGSSNTGISNININSTKVDFLNAYPNQAAKLDGLPANFDVRTLPTIYYKR